MPGHDRFFGTLGVACYRARMRYSLLFILGAIALLIGCESSQPAEAPSVESESGRLVRLGREKLAAGDKAAAHSHFSAAIQLDGTDPRGRYGLAVLHVLEGNMSAAQQEVLALRTAGIEVEEDAPWLIALLDGRKHFPTPMRVMPTPEPAPKAVKALPAEGDEEGNSDEAVLFREGKYGQVIERVAANLKPSVFQLKLLADSYYNLQDWTRAVAAYRKVLRAEPGNEPVTQYLADALFRLQRYDESITFYRVLAEANPDRPGFWRLIGDAASAKSDWNVALASYKKAQAAGYDDPSLPAAIKRMNAELTKAARSE